MKHLSRSPALLLCDGGGCTLPYPCPFPELFLLVLSLHCVLEALLKTWDTQHPRAVPHPTCTSSSLKEKTMAASCFGHQNLIGA